MSAATTRARAEVGDTLTLTGVIRKVYGPGPHVALVETAGGSVMVPLTTDGQFPDENVVVTPAPVPPHQLHPVDRGGCLTCGR